MADQKESSQLNIRFVTKQEQYSVPDTPFAVDSNVSTDELNTIINHLIQESSIEGNVKKPEFDFLAGEQFIRTDLGEHIALRGINAETIIDVEYVERLPAPEPQDCLIHDDWVAAVDVCDKWILTGCYDCTLHLWNLKGKHKQVIPCHSTAVKAVSWVSINEGSAVFISGSLDNTARMWEWNMDANVVECQYICKGHAGGIECIGVNTDKSKFATGSWDKMLKIWSTSLEGVFGADDDDEIDTKKLKTEGKSKTRTPDMTLKGHKGAVSGISWMNSTELITASWDHTLRLWDIAAGASVSQISGNKSFFDVHYSPNANLLITASGDRHVRMYDPRSQEGGICKATYTSHDSWVSCVKWSPNNERLFISGSHDSKLKLWDTRSPNAPLFDMLGHEDKILCCDWTLPGIIASGGTDNTLRIFKAGDFTGHN